MFVPPQNPTLTRQVRKAEGLYYVISATRIEKSKKCRAPQLLKILRFRFYGVGQTVTLKNTRSRHSEHMRFLKAQAFRIRKCEMGFYKKPKMVLICEKYFCGAKIFWVSKINAIKNVPFLIEKVNFCPKWPKWPFFDFRRKNHAGTGCFQKLGQNTAVSAIFSQKWPFLTPKGSFFITKL